MRILTPFFFTLSITILLGLPVMALGADITGRYTLINAKEVSFTITIKDAAPGGIIVQHHSPSDVTIRTTSPPAAKIDKRSGTAKWLIKNPSSGSHTFSIKFDRPVARQNISFLISYLDQSSGILRKKTIQP